MNKLICTIFLIVTLNFPVASQVILSDFLVNNVTQNTLGVGRTSIAAASNGNFAVAWQDHNVYGITIPAMPRVAVQMFTPNATPIGAMNLFNGESRATAIYDQDYLTGDIDLGFLPNGILLVAVEHDGLLSTIVTWEPSYEAGIGAVSASGQIIDLLPGSGVISWLFPYDLVDNGNLRLAVAPAGNFFGILNGPSYNTDNHAVLIQQFDANVNYVGNYFTPHTADPGPNYNHIFPDIATNGSIHIVVWQDSRQDANYDITTQFYNNTAAIGGNLKVNSGDAAGTYNILPSVAMNASGNSVVVWVDTRLGLSGEIFGQRYNASGQAVGSNFQISTAEGVIYDRAEVAIRNDGSFMVVWTDTIAALPGINSLRARARQYDGNGNPVGSPFILPNQAIPSGLANIATNGTNYYCSWLDVRIDNVTPNVYAKVLGSSTDIAKPSSGGINSNEYRLSQNYPNPFHNSTSVQFTLPYRAHVMIKIFDVYRNEVGSMVNEVLGPGEYQYSFDGSDLASGVYFYRMEAVSTSNSSTHTFSETRRFILLK